jgi:cell division protein FtsL
MNDFLGSRIGMAHTRDIPVLKNRVSVKRTKQNPALEKLALICLVFAALVMLVWLRVQTNLVLSDIRESREQLKNIQMKNSQLHAKVDELSHYSRIHRKAKNELKMDFLKREQIIEISKK